MADRTSFDRFLVLIGWKRDPDGTSVALFRTWHSYAVVAVAAVLIVVITHFWS